MRPSIAFVLATAALVTVRAQVRPARADAADWPMYNRDLAGTRHSPLTHITPRNVAGLTRVWSYDPAPEGSEALVVFALR